MIKRIALSLAASALAATAVVGTSGTANAEPSDQARDIAGVTALQDAPKAPGGAVTLGFSWD